MSRSVWYNWMKSTISTTLEIQIFHQRNPFEDYTEQKKYLAKNATNIRHSQILLRDSQFSG